MNNLVRAAIVAIPIAISACNQNSGNNENSSKDTAATATVITANVDFDKLLAALPVLELPFDKYRLEDIPANKFTPVNKDHRYVSYKAGLLARKPRYIAIIYQCNVNPDKGWYHTYLVTYTPAGKEIAREEIAMNTLEENGNEKSNISTVPVLENDSIVELRMQWYRYETKNEDEPKSKARLRMLKINPDGAIIHLPQETDSFEAFMKRFPVLKLPLTIDKKPETATLRPLSKLTPYYNFEEFIFYDSLNLYHYGKVITNNKVPLLLYATGHMEQEEMVMDPSIQLVSYNENGKEVNRCIAFGAMGAEGYYTDVKSTIIAPDGSFKQVEEVGEPGDNTRVTTKIFTWNRNTTIDNDGKFHTIYTSLLLSSPQFTEKALKIKLKERREAETPHSPYSANFNEDVTLIPWEKPLLLKLHIFQNEHELLAEFFTVDSKGKLLDRYTFINTLKKTPYDQVKAGDNADHDATADEESRHLQGPALIQLADKQLEVTPDGRFKMK
ncbi:hypothetical protein [Chitinophaga vietnamensis]|uniref:hypothetical protein n=1 Tax=Chitinophaga vietnamensis TaxID=2593957 RepID=UPI001177D739|nr:hypothetical protein [Chitinophaga vietnamensis]